MSNDQITRAASVLQQSLENALLSGFIQKLEGRFDESEHSYENASAYYWAIQCLMDGYKTQQ